MGEVVVVQRPRNRGRVLLFHLELRDLEHLEGRGMDLVSNPNNLRICSWDLFLGGKSSPRRLGVCIQLGLHRVELDHKSSWTSLAVLSLHHALPFRRHHRMFRERILVLLRKSQLRSIVSRQSNDVLPSHSHPGSSCDYM